MRAPFALLALAFAIAAPAMAHDYAGTGLTIAHPWSRPAAAGGTGAGFAVITNTGTTPVTLVSMATPKAARVELHRTSEGANGVFSMKALPSGVVIPPKGVLTLGPGGYHAMLVGLKSATVAGQPFPGTMTFRRDGRTETVAVEFAVEASAPAVVEHQH